MQDMHWELYGAKLTKITIRSGRSSRGNQDERLEAAKLWHTWPLDKLMCIIWVDEKTEHEVLQLPLLCRVWSDHFSASRGCQHARQVRPSALLAVNVHRQPVLPRSDWHHRPQNRFYGAHQCSICVRPASSLYHRGGGAEC
jgi:hypothetical protein